MSTFVLVHGAWSQAAAWNDVAAALTADGHRVLAPDLPGHGSDTTPAAAVTFAGYVDAVERTIAGATEPVVLVGHSMAGTVISQVAERAPDSIDRLVYLAAFLLPSGQSLYGFTQSSPGMADSLLGPALRPGESVLGVEPDQFVAVFCHDAPEAAAAGALAALRPDPLAPLATPVTTTEQRWGTVRRTYVHTELDRCVSPASQREMVAATGTTDVRTLETGHLAMIARPDLVAAALTLAGTITSPSEQP